MTSTTDAPKTRSFERSAELQVRLHRLVPGGSHTYARGPDQYPELMSPILTRGSGARVWDADGNEFVEYGSGLRSVTLGHAYRPVVDAVSAAIANGTNFSRPTVMEIEAAEAFLAAVPTAEMVKFAKNGSDTTTAAVRLARAATGRTAIAVCEQPFFSVDDWFIGTTEMNAGIPSDPAVRQFPYGDASALEELLAADNIACVIMEPATSLSEPPVGYLESVRASCDRHGTVLVFDEMITGFRWSAAGAQGVYGVVPDLSCWGKAMGNGVPISALAGKANLMNLGGLNTDEDRVFLLSTTHGPETTGLAAFLAVARAYANEDPVGAMTRAGSMLRDAVSDVAIAMGVGDHVRVLGRPSCLVFATKDAAGVASQEFRTLFLQEMLLRGVLGQSFVVSAAHTDDDIAHTVDAVRGALSVYRNALDAGTTDGFLRGRPVAPALRRRASPRRL